MAFVADSWLVWLVALYLLCSQWGLQKVMSQSSILITRKHCTTVHHPAKHVHNGYNNWYNIIRPLFLQRSNGMLMANFYWPNPRVDFLTTVMNPSVMNVVNERGN